MKIYLIVFIENKKIRNEFIHTNLIFDAIRDFMDIGYDWTEILSITLIKSK